MTKQAKRGRKHQGNAGQGGSAAMGGQDTYQVVTDRIIEQLEAGVVPWRKPWSGGLMPQNLASGHEYRGINVFVLGCCAPYASPVFVLGCCAPYASPFWVTFKQARDLGGSVKKGEKGWPIVFWSFKEKEKADGTKDRYGFLRRYTVFNAEAQCENIELPELCEPDPTWNPIEAAEEIAAGFAHGPKVNRDGNAACYSPMTDRVEVPAPERFTDPAEFYSALFHELSHSTGHASRLARDGVTNPVHFGTDDYSKEELVAEMSAAFLCGEAGILQSTLDNSAAYIGGWLKKLKDDKRLVVQAAGAAQKAADLVLGNVQHQAGEGDNAK